MGQLKYAWMDIKRSLGRYLLFTVEIFISFILITMAFMSLFHMSENKKVYEETLGNRSMYLLKDLTSADKLRKMRESRGITERMADFYEFLSQGHQDYSVGRHDEPIEPGTPLDRCTALRDSKHTARVLMVNPSFFEFYKLGLSEGNLFAETDYHDPEPDYIPAVLGADFREDFSLGDSFQTLERKYKVIGFLNAESVYYRLEKSPDVYSLDRTILSPLNPEQFRREEDFIRLHESIRGTYIESDDPDEMREIIETSTELGLYDLAYQSFRDQVDYIQGRFHLHMQLLIFLIVIILTFSMLGMSANIILFIRSSLKEFSIHMLCGAKKSTIILRIAIPFALIWLCALLFTGFYLKNLPAAIIAGLIMAVILAVIILVSVKNLKKDNIERLLRRVE